MDRFYRLGAVLLSLALLAGVLLAEHRRGVPHEQRIDQAASPVRDRGGEAESDPRPGDRAPDLGGIDRGEDRRSQHGPRGGPEGQRPAGKGPDAHGDRDRGERERQRHPAGAASDGTLSSVGDQVRWQGGPVTGNTIVPVPQVCADERCDESTLTIALPDRVLRDRGGVQVSVRWRHLTDDLDLYVYGPDGTLAAKSEGAFSSAESVLLTTPANGDYRVLVVATSGDDVTYEGSGEVEFPPAVEPVRQLLPDLVSLEARNLRFETSAYLFDLPVPSMPGGCYPEEIVEHGARRCLRYDQAIANLGEGPFELRFRVDGIAAEETRDVVQRIYRSDGSYSDRVADTYVFHAAHAHLHYESFAQSHLWAATPEGERVGTEPVRSSRKVGFCMVDVAHVQFGGRGDSPRSYIPPGCLAPTEVDPASGAAYAINGVSVGWADVYPWFLADQYIEISGVADGYYVLETVADQEETIEELDGSNNSASTLIRICGDQAEVVGVDDGC